MAVERNHSFAGGPVRLKEKGSDRFTALSWSLEVQLLTHHSSPMMLEQCSKPVFITMGLHYPIYSELSIGNPHQPV